MNLYLFILLTIVATYIGLVSLYIFALLLFTYVSRRKTRDAERDRIEQAIMDSIVKR